MRQLQTNVRKRTVKDVPDTVGGLDRFNPSSVVETAGLAARLAKLTHERNER